MTDGEPRTNKFTAVQHIPKHATSEMLYMWLTDVTSSVYNPATSRHLISTRQSSIVCQMLLTSFYLPLFPAGGKDYHRVPEVLQEVEKKKKMFGTHDWILHKTHLVACASLVSPRDNAPPALHHLQRMQTNAKRVPSETSLAPFFSPSCWHTHTITHARTHPPTHQRFPSQKPQCGHECHNQTTNVTCCTHNNVGMQLNTSRAQHRASGNDQS